MSYKEVLLKASNRGLTLCGDVYRGHYDGGLYQPENQGKQLRAVDVDESNRKFLRELADAPMDISFNSLDDSETQTAKAAALKLLKDAMAGDRDAQRALNAIRTEQVDNFIKATSNYMSFFKIVSLKSDEVPWVQNETFNEIKIAYLSQDGAPRMVKVSKSQDQYMIELRWLSSEKVGYRTTDIYKGRISAVAQRTYDIAFDLSNKMDRECYRLMNLPLNQGGAFGDFTFTETKKANRIYIAHSNVVTANLPTTNDITVYKRNQDGDFIDAAGAVTIIPGNYVKTKRFNTAVLQEIIQYCAQWGNVFSDGALMPTGEILVPSIDLADIMFAMAPVANTTTNDLQKQVLNNGYFGLNFGGVNWKFTPDVTIVTGTCFPKLNKLAGSVFLKPDLDQEFTDTDNVKNWEDRWQRKVFGTNIIDQYRMNMLRLKYK